MFDIGSVVAKVKADTTDFQNGIKNVTETTNSFGDTLTKIGGLVAGAFAVTKIVSFGKTLLDEAGKFEQYNVAFETMLGSQEKAAKLLGDIKEFAKKTPFNLEELVVGSKRLLAYNVESDKLIDTLKSLGNVTAGVGTEKLPQLILAYGQVKAATKLTGAELRQFSEAGVPLLQALVDQANAAGGALVKVGGSSKKAKVDVGELNDKLAIAKQRLKEANDSGKAKQSTLMSLANTVQNYEQKLASANSTGEKAASGYIRQKITVEQMMQKISDGEIKFADVEKAIAGMSAEGGKFFNLMEKQSATYAGKVSNMQDAWQQFKVTLGDIFLPTASKVIEWLTNLISKVQSAVNEGSNLNNIWQTIQTTWSNVLLFLQPLILWFVNSVIPMLKSIWNELWYFINQVVPPLVAIFKWLIEWIIMPLMKQFAKFWGEIWGDIRNMLIGVWNIIVGVIQMAWAIVAGIITTGLALLTGNWQQAWDNIKHYAIMFWEGMKNVFGGMVNYLKGWANLIWDALTQPFARAWDTIKDYMNKIKDALDFTKRHSPSVVDIVEKGVGLVNRALDGLTVGVEPVDTSKLAFATSSSGMIVNVNLDGAIIGDEIVGSNIGERIGDSIIKSLQKNVRF